jgi:hypothetical protein
MERKSLTNKHTKSKMIKNCKAQEEQGREGSTNAFGPSELTKDAPRLTSLRTYPTLPPFAKVKLQIQKTRRSAVLSTRSCFTAKPMDTAPSNNSWPQTVSRSLRLAAKFGIWRRRK